MPTIDAILYAPRMACRLYVAELGLSSTRAAQALVADTFQLDVRPLKARWVSNSWRNADELEISCSFDEAGIDPRYLRSAEVYFWLGDGGDDFVPGDTNLRFLGIIRDISREFDTTSKIVTFRALDYTTLFLESKPYPANRVPSFTDTLRTAYQKVCRFTGHFDYQDGQFVMVSSICDPDSSDGSFDGKPRIPLKAIGSVNLDLPLGRAVNERIAASGADAMNYEKNIDSWAVWVHICEAQGLITFIRGDECIVTQATDYYTAGDPPLLVYGQNVLTLTERRDLGQVSGKHLCVRAYDGISGTSLESFFPPADSTFAQTLHKKHVLPSAKKSSKSALVKEEYECIDLQIPCHNQEVLDDVTKMLWFERVKQELTGTLTTREMRVSTVSQQAITDSTGQIVAPGRQNFDLLTLQAGDNIQVSIGADSLDNIQSMPTASQRRGELIARGYSSDLADFIVNNLASLTGPSALPPQFLVHSVESELDSLQNSYNTKIEFVNTLTIDGSALINPPGVPDVIDGGEIDPVPTDSGELSDTEGGPKGPKFADTEGGPKGPKLADTEGGPKGPKFA